MCVPNESRNLTQDQSVSEKVDAAGWAVLFIWIGIAPMMNLSGAVSLLGIGSIILAAQVVHRFLGRKWELFQAAIGLLFVTGGIWKFYHIKLEFMPFLCIVAGVAVLVTLAVRKPRDTGATARSL